MTWGKKRPVDTGYKTEDDESIFYNERTDTFEVLSEESVLEITDCELERRIDGNFEEMLKEYRD